VRALVRLGFVAAGERTCMRSPWRPKMLSTSAGPSPVLAHQCGTRVSNSAAPLELAA
jgi:hypothetical protein